MPKQIYYRWASSLGGGFSGTPESVWGVKKYNPKKHLNEPCVFCGLYSLKDFMALHAHKGKKYVWWCGSDLRHFVNGYWLDDKGNIKVYPKPFAQWINKYCESWVENKPEQTALAYQGIKAKICPSFLGDVKKFPVQKIKPELRYYSSVSGNDFKLYGWDIINEVAKKNPHIKYFIYGNTLPWKAPKNVIVRGRVSHSQMNSEIKSMTGAIRMVSFEGFSELIAKSILWGQKPISLIKYPYDRKKLLKIINHYPWNSKI